MIVIFRPFPWTQHTVYPTKYAHGFCFAVLCCGYTLTDFPISIRLTSLALWQSNDCPSASKATLMNMDKYFMWIHYVRLHNHNKAKHNKTVCIFLGIYCTFEILRTDFDYIFYVIKETFHNIAPVNDIVFKRYLVVPRKGSTSCFFHGFQMEHPCFLTSCWDIWWVYFFTDL